jgi:geranyl-CoA carboxylase alpha subunit
MKRLSTLLIANRGEIAIRVMKTAREMGIRTIAVYSEADAQAAHVRAADQAVCIGPGPVGSSYLRADVIIDVAKRMGADAVHPGYGFLSENAGFAKACAEAGIVFVGPPTLAIDVMGDKARAKRAMLEAGVPCVPGYQDEDQSLERLTSAAKAIGMPVMVKAAAGGGGRGMRLVHQESELKSAIQMAQSEAQNAFGSSELIIEKAIIRPRHVEIQVFADEFGNTVHLGERDCSVQRRHQKVIEESPCPVMTDDLRAAMGEAAIGAAKAVNYVGAGTVEFLLDQSGDFYFLEMNTRLQVEHPVTELVTGLDLVEWQLRVARGETLPLSQDQIQLDGHAIEVRLYAEDPYAGFLPSTGPVHLFATPSAPGFRVDSGVASGDAVSPFYDSMVAKIMAHGKTRDDARQQLVRGLQETALLGLPNNRDFLIDLLEQPEFAKGEATTAFIADCYGDQPTKPSVSEESLVLAACLQHRLGREIAATKSLSIAPELLEWSSTGRTSSVYSYEVGEELSTVTLTSQGSDDYIAAVGEATYQIQVLSMASEHAVLVVNGVRMPLHFIATDEATIHIASASRTDVLVNKAVLPPSAGEEAGSGTITAPMHGLLLSVDVEVGSSVNKGDRLVVLEAMKMQHGITAPIDGTVTVIGGKANQQVAAGDVLVVIEPAEE